MDYGRPDLADRLAAAYVAGTLRGAARRRFVSLMRSHPGLRRAVAAWEARLMPLTLTVPPVAPPPRVWQGIERRIAPDTASANASSGWWGRLAVWRAISGLATAAALAFAVLLAVPPAAQPPIVVVLSPAAPDAAGGVVQASFVASISGDGRSLVTRPIANVNLQADRALELWAVPAEGAPRSLGLISAQGSTVVRRGRVLEGAAALAVSLEPPGGSTTGAPTGPILYVGKLTS